MDFTPITDQDCNLIPNGSFLGFLISTSIDKNYEIEQRVNVDEEMNEVKYQEQETMQFSSIRGSLEWDKCAKNCEKKSKERQIIIKDKKKYKKITKKRKESKSKTPEFETSTIICSEDFVPGLAVNSSALLKDKKKSDIQTLKRKRTPLQKITYLDSEDDGADK